MSGAYTVAQIVGGIVGALLANAMFDVGAGDLDQAPGHRRPPARRGRRHRRADRPDLRPRPDRPRQPSRPPAVGAYIGAAYWFTSSTSFANPAVTIGRMFSDTFAGIAPASVAGVHRAQLVGAASSASRWSLALYPDVGPHGRRRRHARTATDR